METFAGYQAVCRNLAHPVVTIGNFDGVHRGHQAIITLALQKARARQGTCVAYTFRPHPQAALRPGTALQLLSTYDEKLELLAALGVDVTVEEPFSREFSTIEPEQFFSDVLVRALGAEAIVVGYDFAFGRERHGHLEAMQAFCDRSGIELTIVPPQKFDAEVVSSSRIRKHLLGGELEVATNLLGRSFSYRGVVIRGDGRGRKIGFPTANLQIENKLTLPYGVYATNAECEGKTFPSVTNVGVRPTFYQDSKGLSALVETHLLDTTVDLYGRKLEVRFVCKLRDEKRFSGVDELKAQIARDVEAARGVLG